jgi:hypothetical protein
VQATIRFGALQQLHSGSISAVTATVKEEGVYKHSSRQVFWGGLGLSLHANSMMLTVHSGAWSSATMLSGC